MWKKANISLSLETDKVNVEVISEEAGTIQELKADEGDTVEVGQVIAIVGEGGEAPAPSEEKAEEKAEAPEQKEQKQEPAEEAAC